MTVRGARLTFRMHRFEVAIAAVLVALLAAWVWMVSSAMLDLHIASTCWPRDVDGNFAQPVCDGLVNTFWIHHADAGLPRVALGVVAPVVGLLLGVPVVAREIELRTAELAWSLALRRSRWLLARLVPMLLLALVGFVVLGWLGERLFSALSRSGVPSRT